MNTRILNDPDNESLCCHIFNPVVGGFAVLGERERDQFQVTLQRAMDFTGVECLAWCCMPEHFHLILSVPDATTARDKLSDDDIFERVRNTFGDIYLRDLHKRLEVGGDKSRRGLTMEQLRGQFYSVSKFMHLLKRHYTLWYNKSGRRRRKGSLWDQRFGSLLVEQTPLARSVISAYIDLNPVRQNLVTDPADYPWCGYSQAAKGQRKARRSLADILGLESPKKAMDVYRELLFGGEKPAAVDPHALQQKLDQGEPLTMSELLRCRVRYFSDGLALGGGEYVERVFEQNLDHFGPNRKTGARPLRWGNWDGLHCLRDLRLDAVTPHLPYEDEEEL